MNATLYRYSSNASYLKKFLILAVLMIRAEVVAQVEACQTTNQEVPSLNLRWEEGFFLFKSYSSVSLAGLLWSCNKNDSFTKCLGVQLGAKLTWYSTEWNVKNFHFYVFHLLGFIAKNLIYKLVGTSLGNAVAVILMLGLEPERTGTGWEEWFPCQPATNLKLFNK